MQRRLQRRLLAGASLRQHGGVECIAQRLRPEVAQQRLVVELRARHQLHRAEAARIVEGRPSRRSTCETPRGRAPCSSTARDNRRRGLRVLADAERARHAEMHDQHVAGRQIGQQIFGAAAEPLDGLALEALLEVLGDRPAQVRRSRPSTFRCARLPSRAARPRRTVSTSGSSGMVNAAFMRLRRDIRHSALRRAPRYGPARKGQLAQWAAARDETHFGYRDRAARREAGAGRRRVPFGRPPLRPDERPDVGRPAPRLEGRDGHRGQSAASATVPFALLDLAGGTGDIAFRIVEAGGAGTRVTVCDINADMLAVGARARREARPRRPSPIRRGAMPRNCPSPTAASTASPSPSASATCRASTRRCAKPTAC